MHPIVVLCELYSGMQFLNSHRVDIKRNHIVNHAYPKNFCWNQLTIQCIAIYFCSDTSPVLLLTELIDEYWTGALEEHAEWKGTLLTLFIWNTYRGVCAEHKENGGNKARSFETFNGNMQKVLRVETTSSFLCCDLKENTVCCFDLLAIFCIVKSYKFFSRWIF